MTAKKRTEPAGAPAEPAADEQPAPEPAATGVEYFGDHDNTVSTGASEMPAYPVETRATHWDEDVVVRVKTPSEPIVMSQSWLSDEPTTKVVAPPEKPAARKGARAETA